jgi:hypothetical protein
MPRLTSDSPKKPIDVRYLELTGMGDETVSELALMTTGEIGKTASEDVRNILRYEYGKADFREWVRTHPL